MSGPSPGAEVRTPVATAEPARRSRWRTAQRSLVPAAGLLVALGVGWGAAVGVGSVQDAPFPVLAAGLLAPVPIGLGAGWLAALGLPGQQARSVRRRVWVGFGAVLALMAAGLLVPLGDPQVPARPVSGMRTVELPTGSRLAYVRVPGATPRQPLPVVVVHGGPGVAQMAEDLPYFSRLAALGFDVYLYDQAGSGHSARLADPDRYTVAGSVADLEALRSALGLDRVILIGHSWGASIAASYTARYPDRVAKVVFSSPGAMYPQPHDATGSALTGRLSTGQKLSALAGVIRPRVMLVWSLLQVNPRAAHRFVGDAEMDARFDIVYRRTAPGLYCSGEPPDPAPHGLGFYANQVPQSPASLRGEDPRPALRSARMPALVLKPSCDYLPWATALEYRNTLPGARLVYLEGAGHQAYQERPGPWFATVGAFLLDRPLPVPAYAGNEPPASFEGAH